MHTRDQKLKSLGEVLDTLDILRVQCPWDRKQTNESLRTNTIEEVYELSDALSLEATDEVKKELGDVLLHILFYSKIGEEKGQFDICDVAEALNKKLIFRHPHIFGDTVAESAEAVAQNWEQIKLKEKGGNKSVLAGVPKALPSLIKAYRIQEKAANVGFDWDDNADVIGKVHEEISELEAEISAGNHDKISSELGDVLFSIVNLARKLGVNPDNALESTNKKFINRFNYIETELKSRGEGFQGKSLDDLDNLWNEAKSRGL